MIDETNEAFEIHKIITSNVESIREKQLENFILLDKIQESKMYKILLGDEEAEFVSYLADVDVFYTRARIERWRLIRKKLVDQMKFTYEELFNVPEFRLEEIARIAKDEVQALELIQQAKVLLSFDWNNVILKLKGKQTMDECQHNFKDFKICSTCSFRHKVIPKNENTP